jgi:hypothetical protein
MSDPRAQGPLSAIAVPIADGVAQHLAATPHQKNLSYASWGAGLLTWCAYLAVMLGHAVHQFPAWVPIAWAVAVTLGLLMLAVGLHNARGPRDIMAAVWWAAVAAGCIALLWYEAYPDWGPLAAFLIKGCYLGMLATAVVRFWIAVRGIGGGKIAKLVTKQKAHGDADFAAPDDLAKQMSAKARSS